MITRALSWALPLVAAGAAAAADLPSGLPENLAPRARAAASSEHSQRYLARFAVDGRIPAAGSQDDLDQAWCVLGDTHRNGADFTLRWDSEVTVAEVVYWGRTSWYAEECWKDCEVRLDGSPVARGAFRRGHGPQAIVLPEPRRARELTLRFLSSHGGFNPGAAEIQVFPARVPGGALGRFRALPPGRPEPGEADIEESPELASRLREGKLGFDRLVLVQRKEINPSHVYTYHVEGFEPGGGLCLHSTLTGKLDVLVPSPQGQILDCEVSFDGREILFSWRKGAGEGYHLYVIGADGTGLRQLGDGPWHDYNGTWLPDGGIAFLSTREARFAYCWVSPAGVLHRMERDGSGVRALSSNIVNDFTPSVLDDGRIIYSRWEYVDRPAIPIQSLWTIHPDGTGLASFYGNRVLSPATFMEARSIPGGSGVLCILTSHNGPARGAVGIVDPTYGQNAQASIRNLTPEIVIGRVDQGDGNNIAGPYESPFPLEGGLFLVSRRGAVLVRDHEGSQAAWVIATRDGLGFYSPRPLRPRPRPPVLPSLAEAGNGAMAAVLVQDVYQGLEPRVRRGEVKEICVVEEMKKSVRTDVAHRAFGFQFPVISCGATYAGKQVWGFAPVAPDGSAFFEVPAGVPIYFLALDAQGRAVQRMRSFTHLVPGEVRGCIGCHEPRDRAPPRLAALPARRRPDRLRPPDWGAGVGFDYAAVVQPVLDRHCVRCHVSPAPPAGVDLSGDATDFFSVSYEALARGRRDGGLWDNPYVSWIPTYNGFEANILQVEPKTWGSPRSKLADIVLAGHPDKEGRPRFELAEAERRRILTWIDLNVPYYGTSETAYPENEGCRRILPPALEPTLADVGQRRCSGCHEGGKFPRKPWTRIGEPRLNDFLLAPLAIDAGGSGACGKAVFEGRDDPDYRLILATFDPVLAMLKERPRMDMAGARPAAVDRSCK